MKSSIPRREGDQAKWYANFSAKIAAVLAQLNMPAAQATLVLQTIELYLASQTNVSKLKADAKSAVSAKNTLRDDLLLLISVLVTNIKANPLWTPAMGKDLQVDTEPKTFDKINYKANVTAVLTSNGILLSVTRSGAQAFNIYTRLQGETEFVLLQKITRTSYTDKRPLATPGVAEIRQYQVRGVVNDEEIGYASDIVTISFGG